MSSPRMGVPETPTSDAVGMERRVRRLENALRDAQPRLVTSLPTSPRDGQIIDYLASDGLGVVWRFRYRAASTSSLKWEFVGGPPLWTSNDTPWYSLTGVADGTWQTPAGDWSLTIPLAGDYIVDYRGDFQWRTFATTGYKWMEAQGALRYNGVRDDTTPQGWLNGVIEQDMADTAGGYVGVGMTLAKQFRKQGVAAGAVVTPTYRINNNAAQAAWMIESSCSFIPLKVG